MRFRSLWYISPVACICPSSLNPPRDIVVFRNELLGSGAAGVVYKGRYKGQDVAIKV